jgi:hypothetical protein
MRAASFKMQVTSKNQRANGAETSTCNLQLEGSVRAALATAPYNLKLEGSVGAALEARSANALQLNHATCNCKGALA